MKDLGTYFEDLTNCRLNDGQLRAFEIYERELLAWNERHNLTAIRDTEAIQSKHFLDSLSCWIAMGSHPPQRMVDVGTGAGFPGIPLKILLPDMHLTLIESIRKKVDFCRHLVDILELANVKVLLGRAEEFGQHPDHREQYDWATARAVASLPVLVEYLLPFVRIGGAALAQKGTSAQDEVQSAQPAISKLGGQFRLAKKVAIPGIPEDRYLVIIDKVNPTPPAYPRRVGIPEKRPLR